MESKAYLSRLKERYLQNYDLSQDSQQLEKYNVDLLATFLLSMGKHMISKKITLYRVEEAEYCFVRCVSGRITKEDVVSLGLMLEENIDVLVQPSADHKRTILTGVLIADEGIEEDALALLKGYRFKKNYRFLIYGWSEIRLIAVDAGKEAIYHNIKNMEDKKYVTQFYQFF